MRCCREKKLVTELAVVAVVEISQEPSGSQTLASLNIETETKGIKEKIGEFGSLLETEGGLYVAIGGMCGC
jgi:hypothetical protein